MNDYVNALIYIGFGLIGAGFHYGKKRWVDKTTNDTVSQYLFAHLPSTFYSLAGMAFAEANLSLLQTSSALSLANVIGALTLGYAADSGINRSTEAPIVAQTVELVKESK
ncbi:MAG: hypothetical protein PHT88_04885 [Candidatus Moranbacteria bacterium]|nr:hypothetical protein [Candidatus Moranbacteria bacterium]